VSESDAHAIEITLRIPGQWEHPAELYDQIPDGYRLAPEGFLLPDGTILEASPMPADDQFPEVFAGSCRLPPSDAESQAVDGYTVNFCLSGSGGTLQRVRTMMRAAEAILDAGGAGVFIDNCGLSHGARHWRDLTEDGSPGALRFAFVSIVRNLQQVWTVGMHVFGCPEITMKRADAEKDEQLIVETILYFMTSEKEIGDGHTLADENGPRFKLTALPCDGFAVGGPMHNPWGRLKLVSCQDIAESN